MATAESALTCRYFDDHGMGKIAPKLTFGPAVPLGRDDPIRLFNGPALDRALRPNDDSLGPVECGHGCRGLAQKSRPRAFAPRSNRRLLAPAYCSKRLGGAMSWQSMFVGKSYSIR